MSLFFAEPSYLALLLFALAPPLVHLLSRQRNTIVLPSILLLRKIRREKTLLMKWQKILLMILRSMALAALAASFAKPYVSFGGAGASSGDAAVIFLFDSSMSRTFEEGGASEHDTAKISALNILSALPKETAAAVLSYSDAIDRIHTPFTLNKAAAAESISGITCGYKGTNHISGIEAAGKMLKDSPYSKKTIVWFTDEALSGFARGTELPSGTLLIIASGAQGKRPNAAPAGYVQSQNNAFAARINSYGFEGRALLSLTMAGKNLERMSVTLKNGANIAPTFLKPAGGEVIEITLSGDGMRRDDIFRFEVPAASREGKLLIVDGNPASAGHLSEIYYIEAAARAGRMRNVEVARFYDFGNFRLSDYDALILSNFWPTDREDEIAAFLGKGGKIVMFAGDTVEDGMKTNGITLGGIVKSRDTARVTDDMAKFVPGADGLDWSSSVTKYFEVSAEKDFTALMRLGDGTPFILTGGGFTFVNSSADRSMSDFALKPAFAPFLEKFIAPEETFSKTAIYGVVGRQAAFDARGIAGAALIYGDKRLPINGGLIPPVDEPGVYPIEYIQSDGVRKKARFIVNTPPEESDTRTAANVSEFIKNAAIYRIPPTETRRIASMASGVGAAGLLRLMFLALFALENFIVASILPPKKTK